MRQIKTSLTAIIKAINPAATAAQPDSALLGQHMKKQGGFVQNFIIPGLVLLGLVIGAIAYMSSGSSTNTDNEKYSMVANNALTQGITLASAIQRAEADGAITVADTTVLDTAALTTRLVNTKFITSGAMPDMTSELVGATWSYKKADFAVKAVGADIGSAAQDDVLRVVLGDSDAAKAVCVRINNKLYGSSTLLSHATAAGVGALAADGGTKDAKVGGTEGCAIDADGKLAFYKVVNVK